jgi:hypothetical protein
MLSAGGVVVSTGVVLSATVVLSAGVAVVSTGVVGVAVGRVSVLETCAPAELTDSVVPAETDGDSTVTALPAPVVDATTEAEPVAARSGVLTEVVLASPASGLRSTPTLTFNPD